MDFQKINDEIRPLDTCTMEKARERWNDIAKPVGSLGKLEDIVVRLAGVSGNAAVPLKRRAVLVLCADNGVLCQGVGRRRRITATMAGFIARAFVGGM
jgi:nicotinate-nucleotide--dimethylbenzimidazole phosphoribosyltransferase